MIYQETVFKIECDSCKETIIMCPDCGTAKFEFSAQAMIDNATRHGYIINKDGKAFCKWCSQDGILESGE